MFDVLWKKESGFSQVPQIDSNEDWEASQSTPKRSSSWYNLALLSIASSTVLFILGVFLGNRYAGDADSLCTRRWSNYSPVVKDVGVTYQTVAFNGSLLRENVFRQNAGPEVDEAWKSLGVDYRAAVVPTDQAEMSGLTEDHVQVSPKYGGGFPANVEGLHHLHCLNLLRQSLYYNFEYYHKQGEGAFKNSDDILRFHVSHCLDILRQQLMCTVDVGVLGQVWWNKETPQAYPDFNTKHKCRNFEAVRKWAEEHQAPDDIPADYLQPPRDSEVVYAKIP